MSLPDSSRLIKAGAARHLGSSAAFNFDDLRRQCDEYIENTRRHGHQLLAEAADKVDEIRQAAHAEGFAVGREEGFAASRNLIDQRASEVAARKVAEQLRTALPALESAAAALEVERDKWISEWESAAVKLAQAIAERILRHELSRRPEAALSTIREALQLAAGQPHIQVRLHPDDLEQLRECGDEIAGKLTRIAETSLVADETISRGGCLVETRHGAIDARLETQLERISQELILL